MIVFYIKNVKARLRKTSVELDKLLVKIGSKSPCCASDKVCEGGEMDKVCVWGKLTNVSFYFGIPHTRLPDSYFCLIINNYMTYMYMALFL